MILVIRQGLFLVFFVTTWHTLSLLEFLNLIPLCFSLSWCSSFVVFDLFLSLSPFIINETALNMHSFHWRAHGVTQTRCHGGI